MANPISSADNADIGKSNYDSLNNMRNNDEADVPEGLNNVDPNNVTNVGEDKRDQTTVFDGYGNYITPYSTSNRYINRRYIEAHIHFYTQQDEYDAYYVLGRKDYHTNHEGKTVQLTNNHREHIFDGELMSLDTDNDGTKGMPTMQVKLFGYRDWEQILRDNDYVAAQIYEKYPDSPDESEKHRTLMTGLISNISDEEDSSQDGKVYTVTCQGMQKVLSNIWLGLPKTAMVNNVNLIYDEYGASNPANESFIFASPSSGSSTPNKSSSSGGAFGLSGVAGEIAKYFSGKGCTKVQVAAILGNAQDESGMNPSEGNGGLFQFNHGSLAGNGAHGVSVAKQCAAISGNGIGLSAWKSKTRSSSLSSAAALWGSAVEGGISGNRVADAHDWYNKMK